MAESVVKEPLTYPIDNYNSFADRLYTETSGVFTDESAVYGIFRKLKNQSDLLQLLVSFGTRGHWYNGGQFDLSEWLYTGMSENEIAEINTILKNNNINYEF